MSEHLRTPEEMAAYLDAWLEEAPEDAGGIARALAVRVKLLVASPSSRDQLRVAPVPRRGQRLAGHVRRTQRS